MGFYEDTEKGYKFCNEGEWEKAHDLFEKVLATQSQAKNEGVDIALLEEIMATVVKPMISSRKEGSRLCEDDAKNRAKALGINSEDVDKIIDKAGENYLHKHESPIMNIVANNPHTQALTLKEIIAEAYFIRGLIFKSKRDHANVLKDFIKAVENNPYDNHALMNLGLANHNNGNYKEAIEDFKNLVQLASDGKIAGDLTIHACKHLSHAYFARGKIEYDKGNYDEAIKDFELALKHNHDDITFEYIEKAKAKKAETSR